MSEYIATVTWERGDSRFTDNQYSRGHTWSFDGGLNIPASSSPDIVPLPYSIAENVDPEEAFVASISSCHMLFFLTLAAGRGIVVDYYSDNSVGVLQKRSDGKAAITRVILRPNARYAGSDVPAAKLVEKLHHRAHEMCFIANSVSAEIVTEIVS